MLKYPCQRAMLKSKTLKNDGQELQLKCGTTGLKIGFELSGMKKIPSDEELAYLIEKYCLHCDFEEEFE